MQSWMKKENQHCMWRYIHQRLCKFAESSKLFSFDLGTAIVDAQVALRL